MLSNNTKHEPKYLFTRNVYLDTKFQTADTFFLANYFFRAPSELDCFC